MSYETVFQFVSVFFSLVGGVDESRGGAVKTDHAHMVSSRKDT